MLEHSEGVKAERSEGKDYKLAVAKPVITNDKWIANLRLLQSKQELK
jgi:hypothetical protein